MCAPIEGAWTGSVPRLTADPACTLTPMPVTERDGAPELVCMIEGEAEVTSLIDPGADQQIGARLQGPL